MKMLEAAAVVLLEFGWVFGGFALIPLAMSGLGWLLLRAWRLIFRRRDQETAAVGGSET